MTKTRISTVLTALVIRATTGSLSKIGAVARAYLFLLVAGLLAFPSADSAFAVIEQPGFKETTIATGVDRPTAMAIAPDGRIFVTAQQGVIRIVPNGGGLLPTAFLNIKDNVDSSGERGLLGIALDPDFQQNKYVYVYLFATGLSLLTDIQVDQNGVLYYLERVGSPGADRVTKVTYTGG